jgi:hypothetical protein
MNNIFSGFNKAFFKSSNDITWYDHSGIMELDNNKIVIFEIDDVGTRDHYNGYRVKILNKHNGVIEQKFFKFQHHLEFNHRSERDKYYHVWLNNGNFEWYISRPKNTMVMVNTMMDWISKFK